MSTLHLLNGNTVPRQRSSEGCTVLPCGCAHTDVLWLQMCAEDFKPWQDRHAAATVDHIYMGE